jgi:hypothetical protein
MSSRLIGIPSRVTLASCGLISLSLSRVFFALRGFDPSVTGSWSLFSIALTILGGLSVFVALLPGSWVERAFKIAPAKVSRAPIKLLVTFAVVSYLLIVIFSLTKTPRLNPQFVYSICPACVLMIADDPSLETVLLVLAPLSAAVYGSLGGILGYLWVICREAT